MVTHSLTHNPGQLHPFPGPTSLPSSALRIRSRPLPCPGRAPSCGSLMPASSRQLCTSSFSCLGRGGGTATRGSGAAQLLGTAAALPRAPSQRGRGETEPRRPPLGAERAASPSRRSLLSASPPEGVLRIKGRPPLFEVARSERRALCQRAMPRARGIPTSSPPRPPRAHFIIPARKPGTAEQRGLGPGLPDAAEPPGPCSSGASCSIRLLPVLCLTFPAHQGGVLPGQALRNIFALLSYQMESQDQLETA